MENKELVIVIEESGLEKSQSQAILNTFSGFIEEAKKWESKARGIEITDISQVDKMQEAREARLALKNIRVNAENARKQLKEKALREGKAIDGIANIIKALIVPIEEDLERKEKYVENIENEKRQRIEAERTAKLLQYTQDINLYNFKEMSDEVFEKLLSSLKKAYEDEQDAIKKAEEERIEKERLEKEEQERIKKENEKLKKEAEAREKELAKEREEQEKKLEEERQKSKAEAEAREKLEAQLKLKQEEELKKKKETEEKEMADKLAQLEAEKQAKLAPEKDKLIAFAESIKNLQTPMDLSVAGKIIVDEAEKKLLEISQEIKLKVKKL